MTASVVCWEPLFLTHQIRISEILPWDRKSYLTHAILPRLSREATYIGCIGTHTHAILPRLSREATYIGCIGTHTHGRQVMSLLCKSDFIM